MHTEQYNTSNAYAYFYGNIFLLSLTTCLQYNQRPGAYCHMYDSVQRAVASTKSFRALI